MCLTCGSRRCNTNKFVIAVVLTHWLSRKIHTHAGYLPWFSLNLITIYMCTIATTRYFPLLSIQVHMYVCASSHSKVLYYTHSIKTSVPPHDQLRSWIVWLARLTDVIMKCTNTRKYNNKSTYTRTLATLTAVVWRAKITFPMSSVTSWTLCYHCLPIHKMLLFSMVYDRWLFI
jgi:hypothetical protein